LREVIFKKARDLFDNHNNMNEKDLEAFIRKLQPFHPEIQLMIGGFYYFGKVVNQNYTKAYKFIKKAAINGYANAQFALGIMYRQGEGVKKMKVKPLNGLKKLHCNNTF